MCGCKQIKHPAVLVCVCMHMRKQKQLYYPSLQCIFGVSRFLGHGKRLTLFPYWAHTASGLPPGTAVFPAATFSTRDTCKWPPTVGLSGRTPSSAAPPPSTWERNVRRVRWCGQFSCLQFVRCEHCAQITHKYQTVRSCPFQLSRHLLCTQDNGSMQLWCQFYYHHLDSTSNTIFVTIIWKATNTSSRRQLPLHRTGFPSLPHLYLGRAMPVWGQDWNHTTPYRGSLVEHFE